MISFIAKILHRSLGKLILLLLLFSCNHPEEKKTEIKEEKPTESKLELESGKVSSLSSVHGSYYSYYIPKSFTGKEKYPAIIFLDPHGKGNYPVEKYKGLAEKFQFILIGSNDSKNGMDFEQSRQIASDLLNESFSVLPGIRERITIAGFSGGSKAALISANTIQGFEGGIYCGAAFPPGSIEVKVPLLAFAGTHDMNYTEVRNFSFSLERENYYHALIEWNGKHEWPDSASFNRAFYWCLFNSMKDKTLEKNAALINDYRKILNGKIASEKNIINKSLLLLEIVSTLTDLIDVKEYADKLIAYQNSSAFKEARKNQSMILAHEDEKKKEFISSFESRDMTWWKNQIASLSSDKNNESNGRVLGYISLASWSYASKAVAANNFPFAQKVLEIYQLADPENTEPAFLEACLYAKNGMQDSAMYFIKESVELGLSDRNKIDSEKDLFALHSRNDYQELISKLR